VAVLILLCKQAQQQAVEQKGHLQPEQCGPITACLLIVTGTTGRATAQGAPELIGIRRICVFITELALWNEAGGRGCARR